MGCLWYPVDIDPAWRAAPDPAALFLARCVVGAETLLLQHDQDNRPDHLRVSCVLGPLPPGEPTPMLLDLLQANLQIALRGHGVSFGVEVSADAVCVTDELPLHDGAQAGFRVRLHHLSGLAVRWRDGRLFVAWGPAAARTPNHPHATFSTP